MVHKRKALDPVTTSRSARGGADAICGKVSPSAVARREDLEDNGINEQSCLFA
jgi:hypothetical protein